MLQFSPFSVTKIQIQTISFDFGYSIGLVLFDLRMVERFERWTRVKANVD